jgi:thiamine-phosphate pyrophosphorylase
MRASHPHPSASQLRGLYAVTSQVLCNSQAELLAAVEEALEGGARLIQYRDKWNDRRTRERNAHSLLGLCHEHQALLIINDDVDLAASSGADGVHIGTADVPLTQARQRLGPEAIVGVTCSNSLERALSAQTNGASYVAFGRFFASRTKPDAPAAPLELLTQAKPHLWIPICAIGGVTPHNADDLIARGADMLAAVEGVFGVADIEATARAYAARFPR